MYARKTSSPLRTVGVPGASGPPRAPVGGTRRSTMPEPPKILPATSAYTKAVDPVRFAAVFRRSTLRSGTAAVSGRSWDQSPKYPSIRWPTGALPRYAVTSGPSTVRDALPDTATVVGSTRATTGCPESGGLNAIMTEAVTGLPGRTVRSLSVDSTPGSRGRFAIASDVTVTGPPKEVRVREANGWPVAVTIGLEGSCRIRRAGRGPPVDSAARSKSTLPIVSFPS